MDFRDLAPGYESQHLTWYGIIAETATTVDQLLPVVLPDWDDTLQWGPCRWQFKDNVNFPQRGDGCLVIFDNNREPWITSWWQEADYIPPAGGGGGVTTNNWSWNTSTTSVASGDVGINTVAWNTATIINISETNANNADVSNYLTQIQPGDLIYLQQSNDSTKWGRYTVNAAPTDQGTYRSVPVTFKDSGAGGMPGNNAGMNVSLSQPGTPGPAGPTGPAGPQGVKGDTGTTGSTGATGPQGNPGATGATGTQGPQGQQGVPGATGSQGPQGIQGPAGPGPTTYTFTQGTPSASWVVAHNLGRYPSVSVIDSGDSIIIPNIHFDSANQVTIGFGSATSGKAYLN